MNLSAINSRLNERRVARLGDVVAKLEAAIAAGRVPNALLTDAKFIINRAIDEAVNAYDDEHGRATRVLIMGAYNLPAGIKEAKKNGWADRVAFYSALLPLNDLLQAAKPLIVKKAVLDAEARAAKIEANRKGGVFAMHCQCCGRAIFAETGLIAHHGYERPSYGWQTASCYGARHLPFEADRAVLGMWIASLKNCVGRLREARANVSLEAAPIAFRFTDWTAPDDPRTGRRPTRSIDVTRATFPALYAEHRDAFADSSVHAFDRLKKRDLASRDSEIRSVDADIAAQQQRFDGWRQTHRWEAGKWIAIND